MNKLLMVFLMIASCNVVVHGTPEFLSPIADERENDEFLVDKKEKIKRPLVTLRCKKMEHTGLIYSELSSGQPCVGSDGKHYKVTVRTLGLSLYHICEEDVVIALKKYSGSPSPAGNWYGASLAGALGLGLEGHVMFGKKRAAIVGGVGCGIGLLLSVGRLSIKEVEAVAKKTK